MKSVFNSLGSNYSKKFILDSFGFGTKKDTRDLKKLLHDTYGAETVQLTYKGREAITLILRHLSLPEGSEVAINGFTCFAVYEAIKAAGLKPHYLDIDKDSLNFSPDTLEKALKSNKKIKAVIIQNTLGIPANITAIKSLCVKYRVELIEDLAHSIGLDYGNVQLAGTVANYSALSFSQDKVVDGLSGGAALFKKDNDVMPAKWAAVNWKMRLTSRIYPASTFIIRKTFSFGLGRAILKCMKSTHMLSRPMAGGASVAHTMPSWYCGLTVKSYNGLGNSLEHRKKITQIYRENLPKNLQVKHDSKSIYLRFPIIVNDRLALLKSLKRYKIYLSDTWYDAPIGPKKYLDKTDYEKGTCPNAEDVSDHIVNLPTHINVSEEQALHIAGKVNEWLKQSK